MLTLLLAAVALAGGSPHVEVSWKGGGSRLHLVAPDGEHVAEDAPVDVDLKVGDRAFAAAGSGRDLLDGLPFGEARGLTVSGSASLSLCLDVGTMCRYVAVAFAGAVPDEKKGRVRLDDGWEHAAAVGSGEPVGTGANAAATAAFDRAASSGLPVLIEFTAAWCPPCRRLEAEVLSSPDHADRMARFVFLVVDAEDPSSFPIRHRYGATVYPHLVVARADGTKVDDMLGWSGAVATADWLDAVALAAAAPPEAVEATPATPEDAARRAWSLFLLGREDQAREALAAAAGAEGTVWWHLTRVVLDPSPGDAYWLVQHAPERAYDWVGYVMELADDAAWRRLLLEAIDTALALPDFPMAEAAELHLMSMTIRARMGPGYSSGPP